MSFINVDEYLKRIKYEGSREPILENLTILCEHHIFNVPFDNIDLFGGPGKKFDLNEIYRVMIKEKRGGFCYELNVMFGELLKELGYKVAYIEGSIYMGVTGDIFAPSFDHILLKVELDDEVRMVDVGTGALSFNMPKKLECMLEQAEVNGVYRFREMPGHDHDFILEKRFKTLININTGKEKIKKKEISKLCAGSPDWEIIFRFSLKEYLFEDFSNGWTTCVTDKDHFLTNNSFLELYKEDGLTVLWGYNLLEHEYIDPLTEKFRITEIAHDTTEDLANLKQLIKEKFITTIGYELNKLKSRDII